MNSTILNFLRPAALLILSEKCFGTYLIDFNFLNGPCFTSTLSKCLGIGIILGSLLVKVPQILKIYRSKSGEGISMLSVTLDLTAITIYASYSFVKGFPFSAWGDSAFLGIQTVLIGILVLFYGYSTSSAILYFISYLSVSFALMSGLTPMNVLWTLQGINIFIVITGKLSQAYVNWKNGHTGQLSAVTIFMLFFGSLARIFTSIQETGDSIVVLTYIASTSANTVLLLQILYYWNANEVDSSKKKN